MAQRNDANKLEAWRKVRPMVHIPKGGMLADGTEVTSANGLYLNNEDLSDEKGVPDPKLADFYRIPVDSIRYITRADFEPVYQADDASAMLSAWAKESEVDESSALIKMILTELGNSAYSVAMNRLRPKTDKQLSSALKTLLDSFPGMTLEQIQGDLAKRSK